MAGRTRSLILDTVDMNEKAIEHDSGNEKAIVVEDLTVGYGDTPVLENVNLSISRGKSLTILGPSGCGKSTLLKALIGLLPPWEGRIYVAEEEIGTPADPWALNRVRRQTGVLFQSGALLGSLTVAENVSLPIEEFTDLPRNLIREMVQLKLDLVKLGRYGPLMPAELSGGMRKRAGLARAMALDPKILFCDEPCAGLDPATAAEIDGLLVELKAVLGVTVVVVTHELWSIDNLGGRCIMLDAEAKGIIASGTPDELKQSEDSRIKAFFQRRIPKDLAMENT
jgi:phospholipid/cholesterol/gamma-HCH transport system ATP-binding protein